MTEVRLLRAGPWSTLIEVADGAAAGSLHRYLSALRSAGRLPGIVDLVPGARTVLVDAGPGGPGGDPLTRALAGWTAGGAAGEPAGDPAGPLVEIPVRYDGADLAEVARLTGIPPDEVVAAHTGAELTVAFCGFAPGFAYLTGAPESLRVPRRDSPRAAVPAGAVALAGPYTGIYPRRSPGGWRLIGHTDLVLWDEAAPRPALLTPGTRVRCVPVPP
ncbi:allophanate hydrolase subunit 1 [Plantactinospora sp. GCM10030261]|uniref:5-oxoprolinase subunit B family protein n=1 Tax=Plantactinospora sp. GCM10030261 TaxID=3273420 RepID=UPI00361FF2C7